MPQDMILIKSARVSVRPPLFYNNRIRSYQEGLIGVVWCPTQSIPLLNNCYPGDNQSVLVIVPGTRKQTQELFEIIEFLKIHFDMFPKMGVQKRRGYIGTGGVRLS